jgi:hypothetical protein
MLLQRKIDDVLQGVLLSDLLHEEGDVRTRVGLVDPVVTVEQDPRALPVLQA